LKATSGARSGLLLDLRGWQGGLTAKGAALEANEKAAYGCDIDGLRVRKVKCVESRTLSLKIAALARTAKGVKENRYV